MDLKTYWTFVFLLIATGRSFAEDGHYEMEEFLKREHSLSKPYQDPVFGNQDLFTGLGVLVDTYPNEEKHLETGAEDEVHHTHTEDLPLCVGDGVCTAMLRNYNHTFIFIRCVRRRLTWVRMKRGGVILPCSSPSSSPCWAVCCSSWSASSSTATGTRTDKRFY
eukprot:XP_013990894.1 PREDICTED: uncharacterized protein LOC106566875 isoform X3 [Salmo salar]